MLQDADAPYPPSMIGVVVRAVRVIVEGDEDRINPDAKPLEEGWIHAVPGDLGIVEHIDDQGIPYVHFYRANSATTCLPDELFVIEPAEA